MKACHISVPASNSVRMKTLSKKHLSSHIILITSLPNIFLDSLILLSLGLGRSKNPRLKVWTKDEHLNSLKRITSQRWPLA